MSKSAVPSFLLGFTCSLEGDAPCEVICLLGLLISSRSYSPLSTVWTFSNCLPNMSAADFCGRVKVDCSTLSPSRTYRRPPGVSTHTFGTQPLDLRCRYLMDMDFVISCSLVPPSRLLSSFYSSARTFAPRFLQTLPRDNALALHYPSPPSGWERTCTS